MPVIPSTIVAAAVIAVAVVAVIISVAPVGSIIPAIIRISRIITVVGIRVIIARSVKDRKWESKGKLNSGARRRLREERQSSDRKNEENELLHTKETQGMYHKFEKS
jgi:hypothetical protein